MTLRIYRDLTQGTDEWLEARRGIVTASVVGKLITNKTLGLANTKTAHDLVLTLAAERITGHIEPVYVSDDMLRGTLEEPLARAAYAEHKGVDVAQVGFMTDEVDGVVAGYSPDGLVGDDGLIEIKSRRPRVHLQTILSGQVPEENMAQIQMGLMISGRRWCDYVSYSGGMPLYVKRMFPDLKWQDGLRAAITRAEEDIVRACRTYTERTDGMPVMARTQIAEELTF